jgi:lysophospholipase L1-like esterase
MHHLPLAAIGCAILLCASAWTAEPEPLLRNGALALDGGVPSAWRCEVPVTVDRDGLPAGVASALRLTVAATKDGGHGQIAQRITLPAPGKRFAISVWARSSKDRVAYLQAKLYDANRKELGRVTLGQATTEWKRIGQDIAAGDAAAIEVLLRWSTDERSAGATVAFAQVAMEEAQAPADAVVVALVGDSTVQDYPAGDSRCGWGQDLPGFVAPQVRVVNHAAGGRSTSTFRSEGRWDKVLASRPQVVLIQFGHNDSHDPAQPEAVDAKTAFPDNLRRYVAEAKAAGIAVVLVTPPPRRVFNAGGAISTMLAPYAQAIRDVATETGVPVIDLFARGSAELARRGEAGSAVLFCSDKDRSHFSDAGARLLATWIAEGLAQDAGLGKLCREPAAWPTAAAP